MATQNEKIARKTLVVTEALNEIHDPSPCFRFIQEDAEQFQLELIKRGYLIVSL